MVDGPKSLCSQGAIKASVTLDSQVTVCDHVIAGHLIRHSAF